MVTVKLNQPAMEAPKAFQAIKEALALRAPDIDEKYGAIPLGRGDEYVVMIEKNLAEHLKREDHPNVTGVFFGGRIDGFDDKKQPRSHGGGMSGFGPAQAWSRRNKGPAL
jgi:hypothetical protein